MTPRLVAFGDISVDVAVRVPHLPQSDEKLWAHAVAESPGGMGANVAAAFATLGGRATLVSSAGDDERGTRSLDDLRTRGVDTSGVSVVAGGKTFWTLALLSGDGEKSLVQFETDAFATPWARVDWSTLDGALFAHGVAEDSAGIFRLLAEAAERGIKTSLDFEPGAVDRATASEMARGADVIFATEDALSLFDVNLDRAHEVVGVSPRVLAVTRGRNGCVVFSQNERLEVAGLPVASVDTTGAGDCFAGAFLWGLASGWPLRQTAELANLMAAMSVTAIGSRGALYSLSELLDMPEAHVRGIS